MKTQEAHEYQIQALGSIDASWSEWFSCMQLTVAPGEHGLPITTLRGPVPDQATLRGILTRMWDLNLTILSLIRLQPGDGDPQPSIHRSGGTQHD